MSGKTKQRCAWNGLIDLMNMTDQFDIVVNFSLGTSSIHTNAMMLETRNGIHKYFTKRYFCLCVS